MKHLQAMECAMKHRKSQAGRGPARACARMLVSTRLRGAFLFMDKMARTWPEWNLLTTLPCRALYSCAMSSLVHTPMTAKAALDDAHDSLVSQATAPRRKAGVVALRRAAVGAMLARISCEDMLRQVTAPTAVRDIRGMSWRRGPPLQTRRSVPVAFG